jgi:hypothetical protein
MGHKWIIDVLEDLGAFARQNDLPLLADHLADSVRIAMAESALMVEETPVRGFADGVGSGRISGSSGTCGRA